MTVLKNCTVGQEKVLKKSKEEAHKNAMMYLEKVGMAPYINAKPKQLSGGQKQRVAIARALAMEPEILLFDEPTSALDVTVQKQVVEEMLMVRETFGTSIVLVTHNMGVIRAMADKVLVLHEGEIMEYGVTKEVFEHPGSVYTKKLLAAVPKLRR